MTLPGKIHISCRDGKNRNDPVVSGWLGSDAFPFVEYAEYVPASEAEALRERVKQLEGALVRIKKLPLKADSQKTSRAITIEVLGGGEGK